MLESIAYRSLNAAAAKHADVKVMAAGDGALQSKAEQMLMETATEGKRQYSYTMPQDSDAYLHDALLSGDQYCEVPRWRSTW